MKLTNNLTPYPILASFRDDYVGGTFVADIVPDLSFGRMTLHVKFELDDDSIKKLIDSGKASYAIHLESPAASYRECVRTSESSCLIELNNEDVKDVVEICTFIVSDGTVENFRSDNFNPDYEGYSFCLNKGDILAIGDAQSIDVQKEFDIANHSSIFRVARARDTQRDTICVNTDMSDYIYVTIQPKLYEIYARYGKTADSEQIFSMIFLPALLIVLARMKNEIDNDSDKRWVKTIQDLLLENNIEINDLDFGSKERSILAVSQKLLGQPIKSALLSLEKRQVRENEA